MFNQLFLLRWKEDDVSELLINILFVFGKLIPDVVFLLFYSLGDLNLSILNTDIGVLFMHKSFLHIFLFSTTHF